MPGALLVVHAHGVVHQAVVVVVGEQSDHQFAPAAHVELREDHFEVAPDRVRGDPQGAGDFGGPQAPREELDELQLAGREVVGLGEYVLLLIAGGWSSGSGGHGSCAARQPAGCQAVAAVTGYPCSYYD